MDGLIEGVKINPLKIFKGDLGNVMHVLKKGDPNFKNFGEAYFSTVDHRKIKGWRKHHLMIMNLVVPQGEIKFVIFDDRTKSVTNNKFMEIILSPDNYLRLTVPPKVWLGFQGISPKNNLLLNIASISYDPNESELCHLSKIPYSW